MRKHRIANWLFFALALTLHLTLLAGAFLWYTRTAAQRPAPPLVVNVIIPAAPSSLEPPAPAPIAEPVPKQPPKPRKIKPKPPVKPKPVPRPAAPTFKAVEPPAEPANADTAAAPAPEPAPASPPAPPAQPPVRTGISVNASYVAAATEKWYPRLSKRYGEQGTVVVRVHVSADGRAERVELKKRSDYPLLDEAAIGLVKSLQYNPAKVDGKPVADWVEIPITFRLR